MTASDRGPRAWTRRRALALAALPVLPAWLAAPAGAQEEGGILVVSRKRILNETRHARALLEAEKRLTAELQSRIDETKSELAAEEQDLARLRSSLPREEFEARTAAFDRRVRHERREAQRQAAALQTAFRTERVKLLEALGEVLEQVRAERGARLILNEEQAMAVDPAIDVTDAVIERFDAMVPPSEVPDLADILSRASEETGDGGAGFQ